MTGGFKEKLLVAFEKKVSRQLDKKMDAAKAAARRGINQASAQFFADLAFLLSSHLQGPPGYLVNFGIGLGWVPLAPSTLARKEQPPSYFEKTGELHIEIDALEESAATVFGEDNARQPASVRFAAAGDRQFKVSVAIFPKLPKDATDLQIAEFLQAAGVELAVDKFMNLGKGERPFRPLLAAFVREFIAVQAPAFVRRSLQQEGFVVK